jgi:ribose transport system permease protein
MNRTPTEYKFLYKLRDFPMKILKVILGSFIGLLIVIVIFSVVVSPDIFLGFYNLKTVAAQTAVVSVAALGMTVIIISGGIDLSVGSVVAFSTVVIALLIQQNVNPLLASLCGILAGGLCGLINAQVITRLRVIPFIATLGMYGIVRGAAKGLAGSQKIDSPNTYLVELLSKSPKPEWLVLPIGVWVMLALSVCISLLLYRTVIGRHIFAVGSNEETARLCGINVNRVKNFVYIIAGLCTGLAGLMEFSRLNVGDPTVAMGLELDVIAAVVIGGGSLSGGAGSVLGTIVGAFMMAFLRNGCNLSGVPNSVQEIIIGAIIIIAVAADRLRYKTK